MNRAHLRGILFGSLFFALVLAGCEKKSPSPGVTDTEVKIGNTNPYSGPASAYGTIGRSIEAYFKKVNTEGGVNGRQINFLTYDDGYSPPKTVEQIRRLVEQDQVAFVFQPLGTPPNSAIWEYMNQKQVPQLFVATGATKWGDPEGHPWTMGWQPNYQTEAKIYAKYILDNKPGAKVGILFQNDDYGKDYVHGFKDGLGELAATMIVSEQSYEVTDPTIDSQMITLRDSGADVFFNVTTPKFAAQAIRKAAEIGWKPLHFLNNVSTSVSAVLKPAGLENAVGLITSAYLKDPTDPQWNDYEDVKAWRAWMAEYYPDGNPADAFNAYGYAAGYTMHQVLLNCGDDLSRENIMKEAANLNLPEVPMLLPGVGIQTSAADFYPIEQMQLGKFDGERWVLFGDVIDGSGG